MLAIYDVWVLKFMTKAVWKVPVAEGVDRYRQHMGHRHLDVGPGTGYFIEKAELVLGLLLHEPLERPHRVRAGTVGTP